MPIYVLECLACGSREEVFSHKITSSIEGWTCINCGGTEYRKVFTPVPFLLKAGGVGGFHRPSPSTAVTEGLPKDHPLHPRNRE